MVADRPAAVDIVGCEHYKAFTGSCLKYHYNRKKMAPFIQGPPRDSQAHNVASVRASEAVEEDREQWFEEQLNGLMERERASLQYERYDPKRERRKTREATWGNLSSLVMIPPSFDKFDHTVFDPMHSFLEGVLALCFWVILVLEGKWGEADNEIKNVRSELWAGRVDDRCL